MTGRIGALAAGAFVSALTIFGTVDLANANLPYDIYNSDNFRVGRPYFIEVPLLPQKTTEPKVSGRVVPFAWIDGALPSLEADRFVRTPRDGTGLMVGRSAYEAAPSACPADAGARGHDAASLVFDPSPERCAGSVTAPSSLSER